MVLTLVANFLSGQQSPRSRHWKESRMTLEPDVDVRTLSSFIEEVAGPRGNVWVIRAQNASESTLINALKKGGLELQSLQRLLFLGLRLGFAVYVDDPATVPRALFEFLKATDLLQEGQAVLVVARPQSTSVQTIIVWASSNVSLHTGKIENADELWKNHAIPLL
ncbi:GTP-binding protein BRASSINAZOLE INSENSITIVE PALE GREEN 2, chloroplastic-like [Populus alba]|uniref:GTP-binding protein BRASSINAZOLE INSENSITIVE PALE GREEN 2, chloroplastic-like n=1 Tax=Populus alba TaxID=43335 RepID=UPI003CC75EBB